LGCGRWLRNDRNLARELQRVIELPRKTTTDSELVSAVPGEKDAASIAVMHLQKLLSARG
ncbi:hypothetical protein N9B98_03880, partial [bacterium]|nr:hypothetical protein [bacterium]